MSSSEYLSRYVEMEPHPMDNLDEMKYREEIQPQEEKFDQPEKWIKYMRKEKLKIPLILKEKGVEFKGSILEIGAGSCWFSSVLSKYREVEEIYALDFSSRILKEVAPAVMDFLNADAKKITRVRGSFYDLTHLGKYFDLVVADETLHHANYPFRLLNQIGSVLKPDGCVVCIRDPIAPKFPILSFVSKRRFGLHERKLGVTENIYTLKEWCELFRRGGFEVVYYPLYLPSKSQFAGALTRSPKLLSAICNVIYGLDSVPVAFIGKKTVNG